MVLPRYAELLLWNMENTDMTSLDYLPFQKPVVFKPVCLLSLGIHLGRRALRKKMGRDPQAIEDSGDLKPSAYSFDLRICLCHRDRESKFRERWVKEPGWKPGENNEQINSDHTDLSLTVSHYPVYFHCSIYPKQQLHYPFSGTGVWITVPMCKLHIREPSLSPSSAPNTYSQRQKGMDQGFKALPLSHGGHLPSNLNLV